MHQKFRVPGKLQTKFVELYGDLLNVPLWKGKFRYHKGTSKRIRQYTLFSIRVLLIRTAV
jgi:hypothetical protein